MARLRRRHLPHKVDLIPLARDSAEGDVRGATVTDRPAYVEQKARIVIDHREGSATLGQQVLASTLVVVLPEDDVPPRTQVTVWKGTARERTSEVVSSAKFDYDVRTPNHVELFLE